MGAKPFFILKDWTWLYSHSYSRDWKKKHSGAFFTVEAYLEFRVFLRPQNSTPSLAQHLEVSLNFASGEWTVWKEEGEGFICQKQIRVWKFSAPSLFLSWPRSPEEKKALRAASYRRQQCSQLNRLQIGAFLSIHTMRGPLLRCHICLARTGHNLSNFVKCNWLWQQRREATYLSAKCYNKGVDQTGILPDASRGADSG